uniref:Apple domain-containing protein n=1 Tax=Trichuris muris TaxID=70415 RepID=A0A5S6Q636_TRIMR
MHANVDVPLEICRETCQQLLLAYKNSSSAFQGCLATWSRNNRNCIVGSSVCLSISPHLLGVSDFINYNGKREFRDECQKRSTA